MGKSTINNGKNSFEKGDKKISNNQTIRQSQVEMNQPLDLSNN